MQPNDNNQGNREEKMFRQDISKDNQQDLVSE